MYQDYETGSLGRVIKGAWSDEEDDLLRKCIEKYGEGNWKRIPQRAGLNRCRKSCRWRWLNYLKPNIKRGHFSKDEVEFIIQQHKLLGNRWSLIASRLPGRTINDVKNYCNTDLYKKHTTIGSTDCYRQNAKNNPAQPPTTNTMSMTRDSRHQPWIFQDTTFSRKRTPNPATLKEPNGPEPINGGPVENPLICDLLQEHDHAKLLEDFLVELQTDEREDNSQNFGGPDYELDLEQEEPRNNEGMDRLLTSLSDFPYHQWEENLLEFDVNLWA